MLGTAAVLLGKRQDDDLYECVVGGGRRTAVLGQNMKSVGQQSGRVIDSLCLERNDLQLMEPNPSISIFSKSISCWARGQLSFLRAHAPLSHCTVVTWHRSGGAVLKPSSGLTGWSGEVAHLPGLFSGSSLTSCVTLGECHSLPVLEFSHLKSGENNDITSLHSHEG